MGSGREHSEARHGWTHHLLGHVIEDPGAVVGKHLLVVLRLRYEVLWRPSMASRLPSQDATVDGPLLQDVGWNVFQVKDNVFVRLDEDFCRGARVASPDEKGERLEDEEVVMLGEIPHLTISGGESVSQKHPVLKMPHTIWKHDCLTDSFGDAGSRAASTDEI